MQSYSGLNLDIPFIDRIEKYRFKRFFRQLLNQAVDTRDLMKHLLKLTHESDLISKKYSLPSSSLKSTSLRISFGKGCQSLFNTVREAAINMQHTFQSPTLLLQGQQIPSQRKLSAHQQEEEVNKEDDEDSVASISLLPGEAFENLLTEKTPSVQQLKVMHNHNSFNSLA